MSRGFLCTLIGLLVTAMGYLGLWQWAAWPAYATIDLVWGEDPFSDLTFPQRISLVTALLLLCTSVWGGTAWVIWRLVAKNARSPRSNREQ